MRRMALVSMLALAAGMASALAQAPRVDLATGARPGNVIGSGDSLPMSQKAGNTGPGNVTAGVVPNLPTSDVGTDGTPLAYLQAARRALADGRTGEAQQALEMAQTRTLDRSVLATEADKPSASIRVQQIGDAIRALGNGQREAALGLIDALLL